VARTVLRDARARFPEVDLRLASPEAMGVRVCGGEGSLRRILEYLVFSACEGDGVRGARRVEVELETSGVGGAAIHVRDDGPGVHGAGRDEQASGFRSAKPAEHGLGLDTAARLVRASGGSLRRENRDEGGTSVSIFLDEAPDASEGGLGLD
jgi:C4-dicarboxylate-specific signal transduction histidine kinase